MKRTNDSPKPFDWQEEWLALDETIEGILARYHPNHPDIREYILGEIRRFLKKVEDAWLGYFIDAGIAEARQANRNMLVLSWPWHLWPGPRRRKKSRTMREQEQIEAILGKLEEREPNMRSTRIVMSILRCLLTLTPNPNLLDQRGVDPR